MPMSRILTYLFLALLVLLQYPLWLGKGGWLKVWDLDRQVTAQKSINEGLKRRNAGMDAEVRDLKVGLGAIEERARFELGMVKDNEVFFQILEDQPAASGGAAVSALPAMGAPTATPAAPTAMPHAAATAGALTTMR